MGWPPGVGGVLPRADAAVGIRRKLSAYSLNTTHPNGGPKARGFALILGITSGDIDYLEEKIRAGILETPIRAVYRDHPYGIMCVIDLPLRGLGSKRDRVVSLRTTWLFSTMDAAPRLITAFPKP
jgi:uncharacterized protein